MRKAEAKALVSQTVSAWTATHGVYYGTLVGIVVKAHKPWRGKVKIIGVLEHAADFEVEYSVGTIIEVGGVSIKPLYFSPTGQEKENNMKCKLCGNYIRLRGW